jgi:hypothetical protein
MNLPTTRQPSTERRDSHAPLTARTVGRRLPALIFLALMTFASVVVTPDEPSDEARDATDEGSESTPCDSDDAEVEVPENATVGTITVHPGDIFDTDNPEEDHWLYRIINRLHHTTRQQVILDQLLLHPGDPYSENRRAESERLLRSRRYIHDSKIEATDVHDGVVDLDVVTRDVWTLALGLRFGLAGGASHTALRVEDSNLLGTGRTVALEQSSNVDRDTTRVLYADPNVGGSRVRLWADYENSSDGSTRGLVVEKPFESLESHWSLGLSALTDDRVEPVYSLGHRVGGFGHQSRRFEVKGGLSDGLVGGRTFRWLAGMSYDEQSYEQEPDATQELTLPADTTLVYPWIGIERTREKLATAHNLNHLGRTEDILVGSHLEARLGFAPVAFGSSGDYAVFSAVSERGWAGGQGSTVSLGSQLAGRWGAGGPENLLLQTTGRLTRRDLGQHQFFASLEGSVGRDLDAGHEVLLGGDSGLRGYPLRYQTGSSRALLTLEQRFFTRLYPFRLAHIGAAAFYDLGRTWGPSAADVPNLGWLQDVGVGLRLEASRSAHSVIHFDVAFPLDRQPSIRSVQFLIRVRDSL